MTKKIVLIEDDTDLFALLKYNLEKEGFILTGSQTGRGALDLCRRVRPDLILLDIMLPDSDGLDICKGIRNDLELSQTPVIFLTARASETDRIVGLELGANDYIVKPFFIRELIARIKLQFRAQTVPVRLLKAGGVELDRSSCQVKLDGEPLALTATEFRLLEFLMRSAGRLCGRMMIIEKVWDYNFDPGTNLVDVYIRRLREKIDAGFEAKLLHTVRGAGYLLKAHP